MQENIDRSDEDCLPGQIELQTGGVVIRLPGNTSATRIAEIAKALA